MSCFANSLSAINIFDPSVSFEDLLKNLNQEFMRMPFRDVEKFSFGFDGLAFDVRRAKQENGRRFLMKATIGYMPFTIESSDRRRAIQTIIMGSRDLPTVHFGISISGKISAAAILNMTNISAPDSFFFPLVIFMQEARPFIQLIGTYLAEPPHAYKAFVQTEAPTKA